MEHSPFENLANSLANHANLGMRSFRQRVSLPVFIIRAPKACVMKERAHFCAASGQGVLGMLCEKPRPMGSKKHLLVQIYKKGVGSAKPSCEKQQISLETFFGNVFL